MNKPKLISIDKTVIFSSPFEDGKIYLTRTGVIDTDSFYHALFLSYSTEYYYLDNTDRISFIDKFKNNIFSKKHFYKLQNDKIRNNMTTLFNIIYKKEDIPNQFTKVYIDIIANAKNNKIYNLLEDILPIDNFIKMINSEDVNDKYISNLNNNIKEYLEKLDILKNITKTKFDFIKTNIQKICNDIYTQIENDLYNTFISDENNLFNLVTEKLKTNIILFN